MNLIILLVLVIATNGFLNPYRLILKNRVSSSILCLIESEKRFVLSRLHASSRSPTDNLQGNQDDANESFLGRSKDIIPVGSSIEHKDKELIMTVPGVDSIR